MATPKNKGEVIMEFLLNKAESQAYYLATELLEGNKPNPKEAGVYVLMFNDCDQRHVPVAMFGPIVTHVVPRTYGAGYKGEHVYEGKIVN